MNFNVIKILYSLKFFFLKKRFKLKKKKVKQTDMRFYYTASSFSTYVFFFSNEITIQLVIGPTSSCIFSNLFICL